MAAPRIAVEVPTGWTPTSVAQPPISEAAGARFTQWDAWRAPESETTLLRACVETPIPGWVEDMRAAVEARATGLTGASVERMTGFPVDVRFERGRFELRKIAAPEGTPPAGVAHTFIAFADDRVATCFAACAGDLASCEARIATAKVEGGTSPPRPGVVVGAASWSVHHPHRAAAGGAALVLVLGVLAVVVRRRPRSRI